MTEFECDQHRTNHGNPQLGNRFWCNFLQPAMEGFYFQYLDYRKQLDQYNV